MSNQVTTLAPNTQIQTELLRLTAFLPPPGRVAKQTWWTDLVGVPPDTVTSKPAVGELQEIGAVGGASLVLSAMPGRVDWLLARVQTSEPFEGRWAGSFQETQILFEGLMKRWLGVCPPIVRLAFGAVLHEPVADRIEGYKRLQQYLPSVRMDPEGSRDFLYQINRPRQSRTIEGITINRLSKWSSAVLLPVRMDLGFGTSPSVQPLGEGEHTFRVELDISTEAEHQEEFRCGDLPDLFREFQELGHEILTSGDIP